MAWLPGALYPKTQCRRGASSCFLFRDCYEPLEISSWCLGKGRLLRRLAWRTRVTNSGMGLKLPAGTWQETRAHPSLLAVRQDRYQSASGRDTRRWARRLPAFGEQLLTHQLFVFISLIFSLCFVTETRLCQRDTGKTQRDNGKA